MNRCLRHDRLVLGPPLWISLDPPGGQIDTLDNDSHFFPYYNLNLALFAIFGALPINDLDGVAADDVPPFGRGLFLVALELGTIGPHEHVHEFDAAATHGCLLLLALKW
eukprot:CAMPEP_0181107466 /NCGR_PEP_ID=MMETSP1071-20121207/17102_1 /TAXON_ID=35127 /ORGANISM="Thalassiosira sp., Strain NH16" /LENGTH=108 /DNA_ID=CAMNT_0023190985 /DNA_START=551 /DNA_END=874 /DNA_ORIENTATION=-